MEALSTGYHIPMQNHCWLTCSAGFYTRLLVREAGLEPASLSAADFKSAMYTIPSLSQYLVDDVGIEPTCHKDHGVTVR